MVHRLRCRGIALVLQLLFVAGLIPPLRQDTCGMPCCRRGTHKQACCCRKAPGAPGWRSMPACPPGCSRVVWGVSHAIPAVPPPRSAAGIALPLTPHILAEPAGRPAPFLCRPALFQRPPPALFVA